MKLIAWENNLQISLTITVCTTKLAHLPYNHCITEISLIPRFHPMCYVESGDMHCIFGPSAILFMDVYPWCQSAIFVVLTYQIVLQLNWSV